MDIQNLATLLAVAAISGLTFLAYKHPNAFRMVYWIVTTLLVTGMIAATIWDISSNKTFITLLPFIDREKLDAANAAIDNAKLLNWKIWVGFMALGAYLAFLRTLPLFIGQEKTK